MLRRNSGITVELELLLRKLVPLVKTVGVSPSLLLLVPYSSEVSRQLLYVLLFRLTIVYLL